MNQLKVAVGISGGVDSAVSALLLKRAGYDVVGVHLYCWPPKSEVEKDGIGREEWIKKNGCRADEDRASALKTALELEIPFKVLDFSEEYNTRVIKYFYEEYEAGRTPNPDVLCNSEIKFGLFLDWALANGYDYIATGHYAKLLSVSSRAKTVLGPPAKAGSRLLAVLASASATDEFSLFVPADKHKDQTYFLWKLTQKELSHVLFPLGDLQKNEVRVIAKEAGLSVADKKDSQGICFVGNVEVREFLARRLKENPGVVLDTDGNRVGTHDGVSFYTIGQRGGWVMSPAAQRRVSALDNAPGLPRYARNDDRRSAEIVSMGNGNRNDESVEAIGGDTKKENSTPIFYVISKDAKTNTLVVGEANKAVNDLFEVGDVNEINPKGKKKIETTKELYVRIRHGGELIGARASENAGGLTVEMVKEVRGVASGQSAVFYDGEGECLGGGVIR